MAATLQHSQPRARPLARRVHRQVRELDKLAALGHSLADEVERLIENEGMGRALGAIAAYACEMERAADQTYNVFVELLDAVSAEAGAELRRLDGDEGTVAA